MSAEREIPIMIDRLRRADIPLDNLCYEIDENDWNSFLDYLQGFDRHRNADLSYIEECTYMGMHIRKRTSNPGGLPK